jgi:multidrug resistance efflux pump
LLNGLLAMAGAGGLALAFALIWIHAAREDAPRYPIVRVARRLIEPRVLVLGDVEMGDRTLIKCELEPLSSSFGRTRHEFIVLSVVKDGTRVARGDVLLTFDSSDYREQARLQQIEVQRARADLAQARLNQGAVEAALRAYRDGEARQLAEQIDARLALARADLERARERVRWLEQMQTLRYASADEIAGARITAQRNAIDAQKAQRERANLERYTVPKKVRELEVNVENAVVEVEFCDEQLRLETDRLDKITKQIEACTVHAPNDGLVVYANALYGDEDWVLEPGARVFPRQQLMFLPNLSKPSVDIILHEGLLAHVRKGQPARVRVPAISHDFLPGHVSDLDQLPTEQWRNWTEFQGVNVKVAIDRPPPRLWPGLSAEVELETAPAHEALVLPAHAIAYDGIQPYCLVLEPGQPTPTRRDLTITAAGHNDIEVLQGLAEGEIVVAEPEQVLPSRRRPMNAVTGIEARVAQSTPPAPPAVAVTDASARPPAVPPPSPAS